MFTKVFGEQNYAFQLYKVFHPEDLTSSESQLKIITLENIFTNGQYNDLGLLMDNRLMIFVEAQSTWNDNMPIRTLLYLAETYKRYFIDNEIDILSEKAVKIPIPEVYVIFTGERSVKPSEMKLSEHFEMEKCVFEKNSLELIVKMIYDSNEGDIVYQYINFCKIFNEQIAKYPDDKVKAVKKTLKICKDKALLDGYIRKHESEVMNVMYDYIFNDELLMKIHIASEKKISKNEGIQETAKKMLEKGLSSEIIMDCTGLTSEQLNALQSEITS